MREVLNQNTNLRISITIIQNNFFAVNILIYLLVFCLLKKVLCLQIIAPNKQKFVCILLIHKDPL